ncbi:MAG: hypothetical protein JWQ88_2390 [Rhodoferax sp.]|nr:hypothetical protein [Rhodoferax sp.]
MNENNENVGKDNIPQAPSSALPPVPSSSRRRLFKLGAAGVPVVITLASSPAMAWNCKLPSAWGSAPVASQASAARYNTQSLEGVWTINNWANDTPSGSASPWSALKAAPFKMTFTDYKTVTLSELLAATAIALVPKGRSGTDLAFTVLSSGTAFDKAILTALLNYAASPVKANIQSCVNGTAANRLVDMARGTFFPSGGSAAKPWTDDQVVKYLNNNYIAFGGSLIP